MSKKHIFLRVFSKTAIFACVFCAFFISPVFATLPAGYTELEYIESTGTQYIQTSIYGAVGLSVELVAQGTGDRGIIFSFDQDFIGSYVGDTGSAFRASSVFSDTSSLIKTRITTYWETGTNKLKQTTVINGSTMVNDIYSRTPGAISIFKGAAWSVAESYWAGKIFSFSANKNNVSVLNLVPAKRNSDNEIGMYDTVSNTFFTNAGTGTFVAGPVAEIKIATTKMVDEEFAQAEAKLATTVQTIESVVSRTISQTEQIQILQDTKQTRPDENCPANMKCLLVQDEDGTPHWYPIIEP